MAKKEVKEKPKEEVKEEPVEEIKEKPKEEKRNREFYWVLGVMAGLVVLFIAAFTIFQSLDNFEYGGLSFREEFLGEIPYYQYSYTSVLSGSVVAPTEIKAVNLILRGDPRENTVPINGEIELNEGKTVYIGFDSANLIKCPYLTLSASTLSSFLSSNGLSVRGGTTNETEANETGIKYVTCNTNINNPVIIIQPGESTSISKTENCYTMNIANCEVLPAVEKFMIQTIIDARARAGL